MAEDERAEREDRWRHLVEAAFRLEEQAPGAAAIALLDSALDVFTAEIDPVEDFEGYAVRRLLLALRGAFAPGDR